MATNPEHLEILKKMGVSLIHLKDGRVQLVQHAIQAASSIDAEDGLRFMQEMIELSSQQQKEQQLPPRAVQIVSHPFFGRVVLTADQLSLGLISLNIKRQEDLLQVVNHTMAAQSLLTPRQ